MRLQGATPTDPDVRDSRIRLVMRWVRYMKAERGSRAGGSGYRAKRAANRSQIIRALFERRSSHLRQIRSVVWRNNPTLRTFPVIP